MSGEALAASLAELRCRRKPEEVKALTSLSEPIFETRNLCKSFGPTKALNDVSIQIRRGQITGLIGENGSGKSTLTSIAAGMQSADSGEMFFKGSPHKPATMIEGAKSGVGMIVQEMGTVSRISVAQNIYLGEEDRFAKFGCIIRRAMNKAARKVLDDVGLNYVNPAALIDTLSMQDRKLVEVAKVVAEQPDMLIIDETTTALSQQGREMIYKIMNRVREENRAVVFISHDIQELIQVCDTLIVLRDGKFITQMDKQDMSEDAIKRNMVGRTIDGDYYRSDHDYQVEPDVMLKADNISSAFGLLQNFSMEVHKGEVLGIGGLSFCGMHELGKCLYGEMQCITGRVIHAPSGEEVSSTVVAQKHNIGYASKDRDTESLILSATIKDNIVAAGIDKVSGKSGFITPRTQVKYVQNQIDSLRIKCASMNQNVQYLSGGNKQKVAFAKWIARECETIIFDCPTRGVDVGVKASMYQLIYQMKRAGKAIIVISEELPELLGICDRLLILKDGSLAGEFYRNDVWDENSIIRVMI